MQLTWNGQAGTGQQGLKTALAGECHPGKIVENTVVSVRPWACASNQGLTAVEMNAAVRIYTQAFDNCYSLSLVSFPKCDQIWQDAFRNCTALTTVSFPACTVIDNDAFLNCIALSAVNIPECRVIGNRTFGNCTTLAEADFPKCTDILGSAFSNCYELRTINCPVCSNIVAFAFARCSALIALYLTSVSAVTRLGAYAFYSTPIGGYSDIAGQYGSVYVPTSLYDQFIVATNWTSISSRIVPV